MNTRETQSTQRGASRGFSTVFSAGGVANKIDTVRANIVDDVKAVMNAAKLVLSEAGVIRVLVQQGGKVMMGNTTDPNIILQQISGRRSYEAKSSYLPTSEDEALSDGLDTPYFDSVFACGDYWLPLSLRFSVRSSKVLDNSQLVDGPNITQRVAKNPKTVNVSFDIERRERTSDLQSQDYIEATSIRYSSDSSTDKQAIYKLTKVLSELFENSDVFEVQNPVLNDEIGINWAVMTDYHFSPDKGSTFARVSFTLQEVNVKDPLLYQSDTSTESTGIPTTKTTTNG